MTVLTVVVIMSTVAFVTSIVNTIMIIWLSKRMNEIGKTATINRRRTQRY